MGLHQKNGRYNTLGHIFEEGQSALKVYREAVTENQRNGYRGVGGIPGKCLIKETS